MRFRKLFLPRLESLEKKTVLSAGSSPAASRIIAAAEGVAPGPAEPRLSSLENASALTSTQIQNVELGGQASGTYTSRQQNPDTGALYSVHASGAITPIGS